jgi:phosphoglycolate phosphatase
MPVRAVLFDFDLTLADSSAPIVACTEHALRALGCPLAPPAQIRSVIGLPLPAMFRALTESGEDEEGRAGAFARHFVERADEIMVPGTQIYPQVPELFARLREQGLVIGIVSGKFRYRIDAILALAGLQSHVKVVVGGEDVQRHKPDPELAGVAFVGAVSGMTTFDAWTRAGKLAVTQHIGELAQIVQRMNRNSHDELGRHHA